MGIHQKKGISGIAHTSSGDRVDSNYSGKVWMHAVTHRRAPIQGTFGEYMKWASKLGTVLPGANPALTAVNHRPSFSGYTSR